MDTAAAGDSAVLTKGLVEGLRQVAGRAAGLPPRDRRRAMELYLAYRLEGGDSRQVTAQLQSALELLGLGGGPTAARRQPQTAPAGASPVAHDTPATDALAELEGRIRSLAGADAGPAKTSEELLETIRQRTEAVDRAVKQTAQEFFDRLMQALDPEAARAYVGKPGLRPAPLYKAAVFEAYAEKFSQLAEYHRKGRLVRDFRASFKRNLRG